MPSHSRVSVFSKAFLILWIQIILFWDAYQPWLCLLHLLTGLAMPDPPYLVNDFAPSPTSLSVTSRNPASFAEWQLDSVISLHCICTVLSGASHIPRDWKTRLIHHEIERQDWFKGQTEKLLVLNEEEYGERILQLIISLLLLTLKYLLKPFMMYT